MTPAAPSTIRRKSCMIDISLIKCHYNNEIKNNKKMKKTERINLI
ncbi:hypothetical protein GJA_907 [Janthinobacterium agaricidamnosum NBRC 102515 = DSM 9628]|uniref:Uncharacterized protein n=1 Tax=Janthinobacterium agaricidamnosum NBRC 102515 = DSM 9628 TaxID=1349767 RepID=W0V2I7_9BURK|nr:hypothetical protein GJA_907 [Janthinobacterium agaricidamnosum NBRC 102515 = DSM 9628]